MPRIKLNCELAISSDLYRRLQDRGLLSCMGEITEDLYFYIQECLARDNLYSSPVVHTHLSVQSDSTTGSSPTTEHFENNDSVETQLSKPEVEKNQPAVPNSDVIKSRISSLYGGKV